MRKFFIKRTAMLEAFAESVHNAQPSKLRETVKDVASRRIKQLRKSKKNILGRIILK